MIESAFEAVRDPENLPVSLFGHSLGALAALDLARLIELDGATPLRAFWLVILPGLRPGIIAGALMAFTLSMDEVIVTLFTSSPGSATLPLRIFGMAKVGLNPMLNALSAIFIVATVAVVIFSERLKKLSR